MLFDAYKEKIRTLPLNRPLVKADLLVDSFLLHQWGEVEMYYAPHNEYIHQEAKLMIIGITPGWQQMAAAYQAARKGVEQNLTATEICRAAKEAASFAGTMRNNLIGMLDRLELPQALNLDSSRALFTSQRPWLHTTSALKYPVFSSRRNYTGYSPNLLTTPFLKTCASASLLHEWSLLGQVFIIPLGRIVEHLLHPFVKEGRLDERQCAWGFPHPSGANGHRNVQFEKNYECLRKTVTAWF